MNHFAHPELIRIHLAELHRAADHHRMVTVARRAARYARVARPGEPSAAPAPWRLRAVAEAQPCPP